MERYSAKVFPETVMETHAYNEIRDQAYDPRRLVTDSVEARGCHAPFANQSTNGLAAGNSRDEAILQATLELVERDATYCIVRNRIVMPDLIAPPGAYPDIDDVISRIRGTGFSLHLKDFTTDIAIPTVGPRKGTLYTGRIP